MLLIGEKRCKVVQVCITAANVIGGGALSVCDLYDVHVLTFVSLQGRGMPGWPLYLLAGIAAKWYKYNPCKPLPPAVLRGTGIREK